MNANGEPTEFTFIVRVRREDSGSQSSWRGSVHEVRSGTRRFITGTRDIARFIGAYLRDAQRSDR